MHNACTYLYTFKCVVTSSIGGPHPLIVDSALLAVVRRIQMRLLDKSMMLCRLGGRIVYSTCSMNPIEDEVQRFF